MVPGERWRDLIVILDDATSEIYYAQLVEEESTATVAAWEVIGIAQDKYTRTGEVASAFFRCGKVASS